MITIRKATPDDLVEIQQVYVEAIKELASKDYNQSQIAAWTSSVNDKTRWIDAIKEQYFLLAIQDDVIAGFGSLKDGDYLDFMYANKHYTGQGIASSLYQELENKSKRLGKPQISAHVSKTALDFFQLKGFKIMNENIVEKENVKIVNYYMVKIF